MAYRPSSLVVRLFSRLKVLFSYLMTRLPACFLIDSLLNVTPLHDSSVMTVGNTSPAKDNGEPKHLTPKPITKFFDVSGHDKQKDLSKLVRNFTGISE
jgi:hypothetical protein